MAAKLTGPSGDLGAKRESASAAFMKRKVKNAGRGGACAKAFKVRPFAKAGGDNS